MNVVSERTGHLAGKSWLLMRLSASLSCARTNGGALSIRLVISCLISSCTRRCRAFVRFACKAGSVTADVSVNRHVSRPQLRLGDAKAHENKAEAVAK